MMHIKDLIDDKERFLVSDGVCRRRAERLSKSKRLEVVRE